MRFHTLFVPAALVCSLFSGAANAGPCDAHFTFDGNIADSGGNGYDGVVIGKGGEALPGVAPSFGDGRSGQALQLDGSYAIRAPLDLSMESCPQVTISAWVKFDDNPTKGSEYILSSGRNGPTLLREGIHLNARGGGQRYRASKALRGGSWQFVAAAIDHEAGSMTVYWRNRSYVQKIGKVGTKEVDTWIGAVGDDLRMPVNAGSVDDVRIFGQLLTADQINKAALAADTEQRTMTAQTDSLPGSGGLDGSSDTPASVLPGGSRGADLSSNDNLRQAVDENAPPDITYASEAEGEAAAAAAEARRQQQAEADAAAAESRTQEGSSKPGYTFSPEVQRARLSGHAGTTSIVRDFESTFVRSIALREVQATIDVDTKATHVRIYGSGSEEPMTASNTGGGSRSGVIRTKGIASVGEVNGAIGNLRLCTRNLNNRAIGLSVEGNYLGQDGSFGEYWSESDSIRSCENRWGEDSRCPIDWVATGVVVHFQRSAGGADYDKVTGLQLMCRRVIPNG